LGKVWGGWNARRENFFCINKNSKAKKEGERATGVGGKKSGFQVPGNDNFFQGRPYVLNFSQEGGRLKKERNVRGGGRQPERGKEKSGKNEINFGSPETENRGPQKSEKMRKKGKKMGGGGGIKGVKKNNFYLSPKGKVGKFSRREKALQER